MEESGKRRREKRGDKGAVGGCCVVRARPLLVCCSGLVCSVLRAASALRAPSGERICRDRVKAGYIGLGYSYSYSYNYNYSYRNRVKVDCSGHER